VSVCAELIIATEHSNAANQHRALVQIVLRVFISAIVLQRTRNRPFRQWTGVAEGLLPAELSDLTAAQTEVLNTQ
jgi:hypothetical protein